VGFSCSSKLMTPMILGMVLQVKSQMVQHEQQHEGATEKVSSKQMLSKSSCVTHTLPQKGDCTSEGSFTW